ncbi:MAG: aspartate-semialdehyde dehydrogenase [Phycisphaerae bacterium]|nr:aspartate-semialdehyde dehydrogenase [Phycisphaerae bacterium]
MKRRLPTIAIVGATGAVGVEFLSLFEQRQFPVGELRLFASARSAGKSLRFSGRDVPIRELRDDSFKGVDLALFSAGSGISRDHAPLAVREGGLVIDNSSAFRMDEAVPLIVPEINSDELDPYVGLARPGIIANPNCSTIILLVPLNPLRLSFGVSRVVVSTYQAVSGAGANAMRELEDQSRAVLAGQPPCTRVFSEPCAFNLFSHNTAIDPRTGRNVEEQKMIDEARKIWRDPGVQVAPTCIRVPVMRAHAESINVTLKRPAREHEVREAIAAAPGIRLVDDRVANRFPTPLSAAGQDDVLVGRIRPDDTQPHDGSRYLGWSLFVCGDQLRKGAALNAVQIAERCLA